MCLNTVVSLCFHLEICNPIDPPLAGLGAGEQLPTPEPLGVDGRVRNAGISSPGKGLSLHFLLLPLLSAAGILSAAFAGREVLGERHASSGVTRHQELCGCNECLLLPPFLGVTKGKSLSFSSPNLTPSLLLLPCPSTFHLLFLLIPPSPCPCSDIDGSGNFLSRKNSGASDPNLAKVRVCSVIPPSQMDRVDFVLHRSFE